MQAEAARPLSALTAGPGAPISSAPRARRPPANPPIFSMATTEVILREKIDGLGAEGEVVKVKAGYARNFLIPQGKGYEATKGNLRHLASLEAARVQRETEELTAAERLASKINKLRPKFTLETGQGGKAFGSVTSMDIHAELEAKGIELERTAIKLDRPIKSSGRTDLEIRLHPEVTATLKVTVETREKDAPEGAGDEGAS